MLDFAAGSNAAPSNTHQLSLRHRLWHRLRHRLRIMSLVALFIRFCQNSHLQHHAHFKKPARDMPTEAMLELPTRLVSEHTSSRLNLTNLPPELVLEILSYLSTSSVIALKLTCKQLFFNTPVPTKAWMSDAKECEKLAVRRYINERKDIQSGKRQCLICGLVAPTNRFSNDVPTCKWHDAWFRSTSPPEHLDPLVQLRLQDIAQTRRNAVWIPIRRIFCLHEKEVIGWHVPRCKCNCNSCGHFPVTCYIRVSCKRDAPTQSHPTADGPFMSEEHWRLTPDGFMQSYRKVAPILSTAEL